LDFEPVEAANRVKKARAGSMISFAGFFIWDIAAEKLRCSSEMLILGLVHNNFYSGDTV
jgi:hypothetical protein